ncbi:MAG: PASTA domain-containing protein [Desulfobacterales bacterium]|nr:PASTA domain-containing protein [Desulfobacterales bacterium]
METIEKKSFLNKLKEKLSRLKEKVRSITPGQLLTWAGWFSAAAGVTVVSAVISFLIISTVIEVEVPDLSGRSRVESSRLLSSLGLNLAVSEEVFDVYVPEGYIIEQDIPPGTYVSNDTSIKVVVSKGPEVRLIPLFLGKTVNKAEKLLSEETLELEKIIRVHSDTVSKDIIIAQHPDPDDWTGETITLIASAGPYEVTYYCPDFRGMPVSDARFLARELGLVVIERQLQGSVVVAQVPSPGEELKSGSTVTLTF